MGFLQTSRNERQSSSAVSREDYKMLYLYYKSICYAHSASCSQVDHRFRADQAPSILNHPLSLCGEPSPKRPKYSNDNAEAECINSRIASGYYHTPEALLADVNTAATSLLENLQPGDNFTNDTESATKAVNQINLFKQSLGKVCRHIAELEAKVKAGTHVNDGSLPSGLKAIASPAVLTLTSQTDRGPKHLYSGLQRQRQSTFFGRSTSNSDESSEHEKLDPGSFPNGIIVTQVPPSNVIDQAAFAKQKRAFGEVFRPHRSLKALDPPRPSRNATRGTSLGWVNNEELTGSERLTPVYKSDYRYASLPTGSWLHYSSIEASAAWALDGKRQQRDRALSFDESRSEPLEESAEHETRSKALFQSAYSSFAPSSDNSAAVVSEETRSQAWWNKVGQKRFRTLFALQNADSGIDTPLPVLNPVDHVEDDFEAAVTEFAECPLRNGLEDHDKANADPKEVDEVLQDISDLLQTLSSYQRIRNLSKSNSGAGTPSSGETDVYEILRSNLSILVNSLPPYAVAKLNGDQLETLNVSTSIALDMKDHVGTMELDQHSVQRQRASVATTHPPTGRSVVSSGTAGRPWLGHSRTPSSNPPQPGTYTVPSAPQPRSYPAARSMSGPRPFPAAQHHLHQSSTPNPNVPQYQRSSTGLQNGYGPRYSNQIRGVKSQATVQQGQAQSSSTDPLGQSPQKEGKGGQSVSHASPLQQRQQQNQASPSLTYLDNKKGLTTGQAKRSQLSEATQTPNVNGQYAQTVGSSTPGGGRLNGG